MIYNLYTLRLNFIFVKPACNFCLPFPFQTVRGSDGTLLLCGPPNCQESSAFQRSVIAFAALRKIFP